MPAVDSLLRLLTSQNADTLTLASDQVPRLSRAGAAQPLSMPPITAAIMETFVGEVLSPEQLEALARDGQLTGSYGEFGVQAKVKAGGGFVMAFKRAAPPRPQPVPASGGRAPSSPAPLLPAPVVAPASASAPAAIATAAAAPAPVATAAVAADTGELLRWLERVADDGASDLILSSSGPPRMRVAGRLHELPDVAPTESQLLALLAGALSEAHRDALHRTGSCDLSFACQAGDRRLRFRVNLFKQQGGLAAAFRPIRKNPPTLAELNLPESLRRLTAFPHGLVLVTGPTGHGKSTTLVALVEQLNREASKHIITLEDPIEFEYGHGRSMVHQRELGAHVDSFESGLRAALREAPDVILVGEMRDHATMAAALTAAHTGHLVLSSVHAGTAAMAVERIVDAFPQHQQRQVRSELAASLRAVLSQHLLPARQSGERLPAIELLVVTQAVAAMIREDRSHQLQSAIQTGRDDGMIPLDRSLAELVQSGLVDLETAASITGDDGAQVRELMRVPAAPSRGGAGSDARAPRPEPRSGRGPYR